MTCVVQINDLEFCLIFPALVVLKSYLELHIHLHHYAQKAQSHPIVMKYGPSGIHISCHSLFWHNFREIEPKFSIFSKFHTPNKPPNLKAARIKNPQFKLFIKIHGFGVLFGMFN